MNDQPKLVSDLRSLVRNGRWVARSVMAAAYRRRLSDPWDKQGPCRVLIDTCQGFAAEDWATSLGSEFSGRQGAFQVRFSGRWSRLLALAPEAGVIVTPRASPQVLSEARALRWLHLLTAGAENLEGLRLGSSVLITTSTGIAASGVAEHVLGLMLALSRRLDLAFERQRSGYWDQRGIVEQIRPLRGCVVGIVGLGANGRAVARLASGVGMRVVGLDLRCEQPIPDVDLLLGPDRLTELLSASDFIVLCVPLTAKTRSLIGENELRAMKPRACLINVARGAVIDEAALARALRSGRVAGAALDVRSVEPPRFFDPLWRCPNLILTPHVAGNIYTFRDEIRRHFVLSLKAFLAGDELEGATSHA